MIIKLVRTDALNCTKIQLQQGEHVIGRGKLLDCNDKRISREHGELYVNDDGITIKALHLNPCFYKKKDSTETEILRLGNSITLDNGDRFGLLPDTYWYEVILCSELEQSEDNDSEKCTQEYLVNDAADKDNDDTGVANYNQSLNNGSQPNSPSLINNHCEPHIQQNAQKDTQPADDVPVATQSVGSKPSSSVVDQNEPVQQKCEPAGLSNKSPPMKRSHSQDGGDVKKIKIEDVDVKQEPGIDKPGPSDQAAASNKANNGPSNTNSVNAPRERCMYGANCYRKNPQHRTQFSHPCDADWGPGERGVCPYGANCAKRDFRHWRDHEHPPGVLPPSRPGMQVVEKHGNVFIINAHTVNFYDDHFQVEDTDGDSVDYDYEF